MSFAGWALSTGLYGVVSIVVNAPPCDGGNTGSNPVRHPLTIASASVILCEQALSTLLDSGLYVKVSTGPANSMVE